MLCPPTDARCITERAHKWPHRTPLMIAAREGHTTLVHYLLGRGAFVDSQDEEGYVHTTLLAPNIPPPFCRLTRSRPMLWSGGRR